MNNLLISPIIIPILIGVLTYIKNTSIYKIAISILAVNLMINTYLLASAIKQPLIVSLGGHDIYGIQLYGDLMSLLFVIISTIVVMSILIFQYINHEKDFEVPFMLFILAGVNGSFLTSDIFNLFVMFEVMLLASFILIVTGQRKEQFKASITYVVLNLIGSWVFLIAIGLLYRVYGTLHFAQLGQRMLEKGYIAEHGIIVLLFVIVFSLKSALLIFVWLPKTYSVLSFENGALFAALLTKVGVYAMIRTSTIIFVPYQEMLSPILLTMAIITIFIGIFGVIRYRDIKMMFCYQIIISIGVIFYGISTFRQSGINGAVLYTLNDMVLKAILFLFAGLLIRRYGIVRLDKYHGLYRYIPGVAFSFLFILFTVGGMPFTGGFPGKLMILCATVQTHHIILSVPLILGPFIGMLAMIRLFIKLFFGESARQEQTDSIQIQQLQKQFNAKWLLIISLLFVSISFIFTAHYFDTILTTQDATSYIQNFKLGA